MGRIHCWGRFSISTTGRRFTLATPDGFTLSAPRRTLVPVGNIRTQGEAVSRGVYQHNRTARVAALPIVAQALSQGGANWGNVARTALAAAAVAVLLALVKYARAFGDPPMEGGVDGRGAAEPGQSDLAGDGVSLLNERVANGRCWGETQVSLSRYFWVMGERQLVANPASEASISGENWPA